MATRFTGLLFLFAQPLRQGYVGQFEFAIRYRNSKRVAELLADACRECGTVEVEDEDVVVNDELQVVRTPGLEPDWASKAPYPLRGTTCNRALVEREPIRVEVEAVFVRLVGLEILVGSN